FLVLVLVLSANLKQGLSYGQNEDSVKSDFIFGGSIIKKTELEFPEKEKDSYLSVNQSILATKITIELKEGTIRDVLKIISSKTGIKMIYHDEIVKENLNDFYVFDETIENILNQLFKNKEFSFILTDKNEIIIARIQKIDEETGTIQGTVRDKSGEPLIGANVIIKENRFGAATNKAGKYSILKLKPGKYTIEASFIGYKKETKEVFLRKGEIITVDFYLESTAFYIGAIEVIGTTELIPKDANTKTVISGAEVEHFQASSIGDVLDLVPGVQKTSNPGLSKTSQVAIRGEETDKLSALGTLVMVDGIPISNNANLQFEKWTSGITGPSNVGGGIDLRTIPADNVESIEVIRGLPSVRYGDVTAGVINVKTKTGIQPHRLKIKNNPDTREINLGGGSNLNLAGFSYNLNAAQSERDIRKKGDEYIRLTGQIVFSKDLIDNRLNTNWKLFGQRIFDEEQPKGDVYQTRNYNRGYSLQSAWWGKYTSELGIETINYNAYLNYRRENSMKSRLVQSDLRILPSGDTVSTYLGRVETRGNEWQIGGRLEWERIYLMNDFIHKVLFGSDIQYETNTGEGVLIDTLFNYYGVESGRLPYSFNDIPGQTLLSIYAEDKITGKLELDFTAVVGFRYEMYRPYDFNFKGLWGNGELIKSHQGSFFNPRFNLIAYFSESNQVRLSFGSTTKSPAMSYVYPPPTVLKWRNPIDSSVMFYRPNTRNPELKGYKEWQYEISYDQKIGNLIGASLTAYYKQRKQDPSGQSIPIFYYREINANKYLYYIGEYSIQQNLGWSQSKGVELTLRSSKIKPLNMEFQVVGSYNFIKRGTNAWQYDENPDQSLGRFPNFKVPGIPIDTLYGFVYDASMYWSDRLILNYFVKYTHPNLGLWVTIRAENTIFERRQNYNLIPINFSVITDSTKLATVKLSREFDERVKKKPAKWLFNINISKSLFKGAEISFYVNNFLDDPAIYRYQYTYDPNAITEEVRNPSLFYGIEFSMIVDELFKGW
ncbi:MAG: TonB-dependent receptor, partial [Ignavibacteria bacterium]